MRALRAVVLSPLLGLAAVSPVRADLIDGSSYDLTNLGGKWAWGQTAWNAIQTEGIVDNEADLAEVEALLKDGYAYSAPVSGPVNGIFTRYDPTREALSLTFEFKDGASYLITALSFLASASGSALTLLSFDFRLDNGEWQNAVYTSTGGLGVVNGQAKTYFFSPEGEIIADAFRIVIAPQTNGANFSLHEISVFGEALIPEPSTYALLGGLVALGLAWRRRR